MKKIVVEVNSSYEGTWHLIAKYQLENLIDPSLGVEKFIRNITPDMIKCYSGSTKITPNILVKIGRINDPQLWRLVGDFSDSFHLIYSCKCYPQQGSFINCMYLEDWMVHPDDDGGSSCSSSQSSLSSISSDPFWDEDEDSSMSS
jgi:hypothetical protein